ncbi:MAG: ATP synthase F1 subunit delta [Omnitrophica bacterium RIFCSPHIGHO2_02_FULL_46_11]|nr:MAG: ATP synthase F1 subunit delta [Omnitrophica bacterium RIFCSPLOWO2_01_FULL_45_10b]OGW87845.1 MAG: ATP synthase F1 subunit delta [Omnitrophica bacterium RIFCSPHIGHO2_02_FULL_46_11]
MIPFEIVNRYSRSVFELAEEKGVTDALFQELSAVHEATRNRPELLNLLQSPLITRGEKRALIEGILGSKANSLSRQFLNLLVQKNRTDLFPFIVEQLQDLMNKKHNVQEATVVTARELHPSIIQLIQKALEGLFKKKVTIETDTDPDLIGGLQIRLGNRLIDGTLRAKLNALHAQLKNVRV